MDAAGALFAFPAGTVAAMHIVRTGRHELTELPDVHACSACGQPFTPPHYSTSWHQCLCTDGQRGHRIYTCMRGECRAATFDPPCFTQEGATADYGDG